MKGIFKLIKILISLMLYYSGLVSIIRILGHKGIKILAYHRVGINGHDYLNMSIPVSDFETQIKYLCKNYNLVSLASAINFIKSNKKNKKNTVVITFDDGYKDNYTQVFPIIKKFKVPLTIFLCVGPIVTGQPLWYDIIAHLILNTQRRKVDLSNYGMKNITLSNSIDKREAINNIINHAKIIKEKHKQNLLKYLHKQLDINIYVDKIRRQMMSWEEIKEMKDYGVTFGAHTVNHPILTKISLRTAELEIKNSKNAVEKEFNEPVSFFAYPNGDHSDFNEDIINIVKKSGFSCACSLIDGFIKTGDDLFTLKRVGIDDKFISRSKFVTKALFATEMAGIFDIIFMRFLRN